MTDTPPLRPNRYADGRTATGHRSCDGRLMFPVNRMLAGVVQRCADDRQIRPLSPRLVPRPRQRSPAPNQRAPAVSRNMRKAFRASLTNSITFASLFRPEASSRPVWASTPDGRTARIAPRTLAGLSPPARITGREDCRTSCLLRRQSWVLPVAPEAPVSGSNVSVKYASTYGVVCSNISSR